LSTISSRFAHAHPVLSRTTSQGGRRTFLRESLRAMLIGLASLEPMAAVCLAQADPQTAAAGEASGRG
jgi:hypothetical protein